jgi:hypothetical protein
MYNSTDSRGWRLRDSLARIVLLAIAFAILARAQNTLLSTTATGGVNASLAGMAVDPAGNRYLAIFLQNNRIAPDPLILPGRDPTRVIVVQKISVDR